MPAEVQKEFDFENKSCEEHEQCIRHYFKVTMFGHFRRFSKDFYTQFKFVNNSVIGAIAQNAPDAFLNIPMKSAIETILNDHHDPIMVRTFEFNKALAFTQRGMVTTYPNDAELIRTCIMECLEFAKKHLEEKGVQGNG